MNNYCRNCGKPIEKNTKFCTNCGAEVFEERIDVEKEKKELEEFRNKENIYMIVVICMYVLPYLLEHFNFVSDSFSSFINPLVYLCATVILIYAKITMRNSEKIKILFYIIISLVILYIISMIFLIATCLGTARLMGCY